MQPLGPETAGVCTAAPIRPSGDVICLTEFFACAAACLRAAVISKVPRGILDENFDHICTAIVTCAPSLMLARQLCKASAHNRHEWRHGGASPVGQPPLAAFPAPDPASDSAATERRRRRWRRCRARPPPAAACTSPSAGTPLSARPPGLNSPRQCRSAESAWPRRPRADRHTERRRRHPAP